MADIKSLVQSLSGGMKRDFARDAMPQNSLWNMVDILPEVLDSRARKRGGYVYESQDLNSVHSGSSVVVGGIYAPYSDGNSLLAFDEDGRAYEIESLTATENIGALTEGGSWAPVFYSDKVIAPEWSGVNPPTKITRAAGVHTLAALGGTPPAGRYAVVYKDVLWLASSSAQSDRIWFSTAGNPEDTWDTTNKWLDASLPITGMVALQNAVFVFTLSRTIRVRGSVPPPDSDFIVDDPIFDVGCTDFRSITTYRDKVIWGNAQGLYISDGSAIDDLTRICGMKSWWLDVMSGREGFSTGSSYVVPGLVSGWSIVVKTIGDYLVYSILNGFTRVDSGIIDMTRYSWFRISNLDAYSMWKRPYPDELYFGRMNAPRVASLSSLFNPTSAVKADADGTNVLPQFETPYLMGRPSLKTFRRVFQSYDLRDSASDDPTLTLSYIDSPEQTSYTALTGTLPETTAIARVHRDLNRPARGVAIKVAQTGPSADTRFYDLEVEYQEREGFK